MSQFLETIRIEHQKPQHLEWHNQRFNQTRKHFFGIEEPLDLHDFIKIPSEWTNQTTKCRVIYDIEIRKIELHPYQTKPIKNVMLVEVNDIDYSFKYLNRSIFESLNSFDGEILIVKNGFITDFSYANIALFDGKNWITPITYLLNGTTRQRLLNEGKIIEKEIKVIDLVHYSQFKPMNAMLEFEETKSLPIELIQ